MDEKRFTNWSKADYNLDAYRRIMESDPDILCFPGDTFYEDVEDHVLPKVTRFQRLRTSTRIRIHNLKVRIHNRLHPPPSGAPPSKEELEFWESYRGDHDCGG